jgi:hypothetical protein
LSKLILESAQDANAVDMRKVLLHTVSAHVLEESLGGVSLFVNTDNGG